MLQRMLDVNRSKFSYLSYECEICRGIPSGGAKIDLGAWPRSIKFLEIESLLFSNNLF